MADPGADIITLDVDFGGARFQATGAAGAVLLLFQEWSDLLTGLDAVNPSDLEHGVSVMAVQAPGRC